LLGVQEVPGSNPGGPTNRINQLQPFFGCLQKSAVDKFVAKISSEFYQLQYPPSAPLPWAQWTGRTSINTTNVLQG
jgi:hypothetical protein